ncbi:hypothetical protein Goe17_02200 [Bacillus phage vB_BsuM-Goe17]|nr:hypothetical protein Goe17_02200 [Bacillus phage vB_BsuM-Goe17]
MLKIVLYDDGRIETEEVESSDYRGWMKNKSVGGYRFAHGMQSGEVILLDGDKKEYHFNRVMRSKFREVDKEIKRLEQTKKELLKIGQEISRVF